MTRETWRRSSRPQPERAGDCKRRRRELEARARAAGGAIGRLEAPIPR